jgi:hypothetical protein
MVHGQLQPLRVRIFSLPLFCFLSLVVRRVSFLFFRIIPTVLVLVLIKWKKKKKNKQLKLSHQSWSSQFAARSALPQGTPRWHQIRYLHHPLASHNLDHS